MTDRLLLAVAGALCVLLFIWGCVQTFGKLRAERALLQYQASAAQVITERLEENARIEDATNKRIDEVRLKYEKSLSDSRTRYERVRRASGGGGNPVPKGSAGSGGAVDAGGPELQLPRCVGADRREELLALLERADSTAQALKACQESHAR